jgi:hypothetical protein
MAVEVVVALSPIPTDFEECITQGEEEGSDKKGYSDVCIDGDGKFARRRKGLVRHGCIDDASTCRSSWVRDRERVDGGITARSENSSSGLDGGHRGSDSSLIVWRGILEGMKLQVRTGQNQNPN